MCVVKALEWMSVVSDREVLVLFVRFDGEDFGRNISEGLKENKVGSLEMKTNKKIEYITLTYI